MYRYYKQDDKDYLKYTLIEKKIVITYNLTQ